ncbi:Uncharacterised protein [Mycobacterium tuberculosis]|uniref:Uncharacterized protein n=1 Tax=Mycobacterium tuberculosis TaxID=1773 RepID=A0A916LAJ3_MYCTX|nr:Uncharacterised protein [Mycobacterium tuberculosis]
MDNPMPAPRTTRYSDCSSGGVHSSICDISRNATAISAIPATGKIL